MSTDLDPRVIELGVTINDSTTWYKNLYISARGSKYTSANMGGCNLTVLGLSRDSREYLLRQTNPMTSDADQVGITLEVGRESYGTSTLYKGDAFRSSIVPKPDLGLNIRCLVGYYNKGVIVTRSGSKNTLLSNIAQWIATDCGYSLSFEITDGYVARYAFTGSAQSQLTQFADLAKAQVYVDNDIMYVKDKDSPSTSAGSLSISKYTGMIGVPEVTEVGCKVTMLYTPAAKIGCQFSLESEVNPSLNGDYIAYKVDYDVSNRDNPFYITLEGRKYSG